jgi:hypothetical protein
VEGLHTKRIHGGHQQARPADGRDRIGCTELRTAEGSPLCLLYLDHGLAQNLRKRLPREAAGSIAGRDDANHPGPPSASKHGLPAQAKGSESGTHKEG